MIFETDQNDTWDDVYGNANPIPQSVGRMLDQLYPGWRTEGGPELIYLSPVDREGERVRPGDFDL
jgi:hypothetical protein